MDYALQTIIWHQYAIQSGVTTTVYQYSIITYLLICENHLGKYNVQGEILVTNSL